MPLSQTTSIERLKDIQKPTLRRSSDYAYETLAASLGTGSVCAHEDDPPLGSNDDGSIASLSTRDSFYQLSLCSKIEETKLEVVRIILSDATKNLCAKEPDTAISSRTNIPDHIQEYSTNKPQASFSLQASPVKKDNDTLNSLDCSIDVNLKSIDASVTGSNQESVALSKRESSFEHSIGVVTESKWVEFKEPFVQCDESEPAGVSFLSQIPDEDDDAFAESNVFAELNPHANKSPCNDDANAAMVRELEELRGRISSLEQIVRGISGMENSPTRLVSDSTHSDQSHLAPQDVAFVIEGTDILYSSRENETSGSHSITCEDYSLRENETGGSQSIACEDWAEELHQHQKGGKFSLKRMIQSRLFGGNKKASNAGV